MTAARSRLHQRVVRLRSQMVGTARFVPYSQQWFAYWEDQFDRVLRCEPSERIPLEFCDALLARVAKTSDVTEPSRH